MNKLIFPLFLTISCVLNINASTNIPLPEHPRPDFERKEWINLNGEWGFTFNPELADKALKANSISVMDSKISVPFSWGSKLSGIENKADIAWYGRSILIPESWHGKRVFLVIGACEWDTNVWIDGHLLGSHQGGYTPFEFELTSNINYGKEQNIIIRADDTPSEHRLNGKQGGYGDVRGIWQTVYLEARGDNYIDYIHFSPDIDNSSVEIKLALDQIPDKNSQIKFVFKNGEQADFIYPIKGKNAKSKEQQLTIKLENQRLWDLDNPYLYEMEILLVSDNKTTDKINTYFGQRKIGVTDLPGLNHPYVSLNNKPIYLQMCLDQSYHPDGYYTFPSDEFMRNEILLSKRLGLNGNRIHIKVEIPRKLYWADKLGLLIMADTPNWWGEPNDSAKKDWEFCLVQQVKRDYNHPSIFSWVNFNETWGLFTNVNGKKIYLPETQEWVRQKYLETKKMDPTRLVEDNSPCNNDHVQTDINTWHAYYPGYKWKTVLDGIIKNTYEGSSWNYIGDNKQIRIPTFNSECGNVWGYTGSTGDVDFTWDYHIMMNEFRSHPQCAGWLYTEHHDVIKEWNGYVRIDRSEKVDGLSDLVPDMSIADFHSPYFIAPQGDLCREVNGGDNIEVPLFASFMTDKNPGLLNIEVNLLSWDGLGRQTLLKLDNISVQFKAFMNELIAPAKFVMPENAGVYVLQFILKNEGGITLGRNFSILHNKNGKKPDLGDNTVLYSFEPKTFTDSKWSIKQWNVLDGLKVNGTGSGYLEYSIPWPAGITLNELESVNFVFEASAKQLFGKDAIDLPQNLSDLDLASGKGSLDPCHSKNAYAMTDGTKFPSVVKIKINNTTCGEAYLEDDPADHRGILSWNSQPKNNTLSEAGSYGYLIQTIIPKDCLKEGENIRVRLEVPSGIKGGLAIYGKDFGRYPLDPTFLFVKKNK